QRRDPNSMLNWIERLIRLRKESPELGWGTYKLLETGNSSVLALRYDWRHNAMVTLHNFQEKPTSITLDLGREGRQLVNLGVGEHSEAGKDGIHRIFMEGYGYRWYRVGGLGYILRREKY